LELTDGINDMTKRSQVKELFERFGSVSACWLPPVGFRVQPDSDLGYVKFERVSCAQSAKEACDNGQVFLWERQVGVQWKTSVTTGKDYHNFEAKGSNLTSARDLFLESLKTQGTKRRKSLLACSSSSSTSSRRRRKKKKKDHKDDKDNRGRMLPLKDKEATITVAD